MFDNKALTNSIVAGSVLQCAMVIAGHFVPYIALNVFMFGGMGISALAGLLYGRAVGSYNGAVGGGAIAGAVCALIGIALSVELGDTPAEILVMGTGSSAVAGAIGGIMGRLVGGPASAAD